MLIPSSFMEGLTQGIAIDQRFDYFIDVLMYKCLHDIAPQYLISQFKYVDSNTRSANRGDLVVPHPNIEIFLSFRRYLTFSCLKPLTVGVIPCVEQSQEEGGGFLAK